MYQKDFILKMIEMLGELVAGILALITKGNYEKASETLESTYYDMLKQDAAFFHKIPMNKLTDKLLNEHNYTNNHLEVLAELFYTEGELNYAQQKHEHSLMCYQKTLLLHEFVTRETKVFSFEKESKIEKIKARISALNNTTN